jgi:hypothetical protein
MSRNGFSVCAKVLVRGVTGRNLRVTARRTGVLEGSALKQPGVLQSWFDPTTFWLAEPSGKLGRPARLTSAALRACLTKSALFCLPLRQMTGLVTGQLDLARAGLRGTGLRHLIALPGRSERRHPLFRPSHAASTGRWPHCPPTRRGEAPWPLSRSRPLESLRQNLSPSGKLMESETLVEKASHNSKQQFSNSPDLRKAILDAIEAHSTMSKPALDSSQVRKGL